MSEDLPTDAELESLTVTRLKYAYVRAGDAVMYHAGRVGDFLDLESRIDDAITRKRKERADGQAT
jgi:hypothetical protein